MIRSRLPRVLLLAALSLALSLGCSNRKGRVLGNERLLRGDDLGTTTRVFAPPDRDTYVSTGEANFGQTLIVGLEPTRSFEARAFFRRPDKWVLPDTNVTGVVIDSITFRLVPDELAPDTRDFSATLATTMTDYDPAAGWPGPMPSSSVLGTIPSTAPVFQVPISPSAFPLFQGWAADTLSFPGLVLYPNTGQGVVGVQAGTATLAIKYTYDGAGGVRDTATAVTAFPNDHYLHAPAPAATGTETTLLLGGLFERGIAVRFPPVTVLEGHTVNEATILLHVDASDPLGYFPANRKTPLLVRRLSAPWLESATDTTSLGSDAAVYATSDSIQVRSPADSVFSIALPQAIVRQWNATGAVNEGLLITVADANRHPEIRVGSRESPSPIELRISTTGPPPGRF